MDGCTSHLQQEWKQPWESRHPTSGSAVCSIARRCWECTKCSGSFFSFSYEEMDVMLIKYVLVKQGPGFIMYVCLMIRCFQPGWRGCKVGASGHLPLPHPAPLLGSPMESLVCCSTILSVAWKSAEGFVCWLRRSRDLEGWEGEIWEPPDSVPGLGELCESGERDRTEFPCK